MQTFIRRIIVGFAIGLTMGSAFAAAPTRKPANNSFKEAKPMTSREVLNTGNEIFAETETFQVHSTRVGHVLEAMNKLGLSEDVDFAWMNKVPSAKVVSFVCYSIDCYHWAKKSLRTIAVAPARPEESIGLQWHDKAIDNKKERALSEDEKIKARHELRYSAKKDG
ncbi:MAG: hypothetical protein JST04_10805 [Bdellovibrionales bacterium]|nr:hypothetical protein [Bdellovibrionales bacterium]